MIQQEKDNGRKDKRFIEFSILNDPSFLLFKHGTPCPFCTTNATAKPEEGTVHCSRASWRLRFLFPVRQPAQQPTCTGTTTASSLDINPAAGATEQMGAQGLAPSLLGSPEYLSTETQPLSHTWPSPSSLSKLPLQGQSNEKQLTQSPALSSQQCPGPISEDVSTFVTKITSSVNA